MCIRDSYSTAESTLTGLDGGSMHDPLAIAAIVAPEILHFEPMHVAIELTLSLIHIYPAQAVPGWPDTHPEPYNPQIAGAAHHIPGHTWPGL